MRWLLLIAVLIVVAVVVLRRQRGHAAPARAAHSGNRLPRIEAFHAVEIEPGSTHRCCDAVLRQAGQRYLSSDAPSLPLAECTIAARCGCHYVHHDDRRGEPRRRSDAGLPDSILAHERDERRRSPERRDD